VSLRCCNLSAVTQTVTLPKVKVSNTRLCTVSTLDLGNTSEDTIVALVKDQTVRVAVRLWCCAVS
jgi:hypothetical protein